MARRFHAAATAKRELAMMRPTPCSDCGEVFVGKNRCPKCKRYFCDVCWNSQHLNTFDGTAMVYSCEIA